MKHVISIAIIVIGLTEDTYAINKELGIMLIDKEKPARIFLSRGLTTLDEIEKRIVNVITEREESDEARH